MSVVALGRRVACIHATIMTVGMILGSSWEDWITHFESDHGDCNLTFNAFRCEHVGFAGSLNVCSYEGLSGVDACSGRVDYVC